MASWFSSLLRRFSALQLASIRRRAAVPKVSDSRFQDGGFRISSSVNYTSASVDPGPRVSVSSENLTTSQNLITIIDGEITSASMSIPDLHGAKPFRFPFKIEDDTGTKTLLLKRKFRNEDISVMVNLANGVTDEKEGDGDGVDRVSIPLAVKIRKRELSFWLEFGLIAYSDEIVVDYMITKSLNVTDNGFPYEGRDFRDLEENMQKAVFEYLAIRGIEHNVTSFLIAYMMAKEGKEYVHWLKILRQFCH